MASGEDGAGVFRSPGGTVWGRDEHGALYKLPPEARDAWRPDERHRVLAEAIDRAGLWEHLPAEARAKEVSEVASGRYPLSLEALDGHVVFDADGENLAEGGVEQFLAELAPALARHEVMLEVGPVDWGPDDGHELSGNYVLPINGIRCVILERQDWERQNWERGTPWELATTRPLAVVNQLLAAAGSPVRAHTLYAGGNEGLVFLMSPQVAQAMRASGLFPEREIPHCP